MFQHVLVPLDYRFLPRRALLIAAELAIDQNAKITLLHVVDVSRDRWHLGFTVVTQAEVEAHLREVHRFIENAAAKISEYGAVVSTFVAEGGPVHRAIKAAAVSVKADIIVMGARRRPGLVRFLLGSVTKDVLREASIPVLVIHESRFPGSAPLSANKL
jgi:nucleotide-binding universal stress UspA family protein